MWTGSCKTLSWLAFHCLFSIFLNFAPCLLLQLCFHGSLLVLASFPQAAADKCVSVDFLLFEQKSSHLSNTKENINNFQTCISDLDNCSFQAYLPGFPLLPFLFICRRVGHTTAITPSIALLISVICSLFFDSYYCYGLGD